MTHIHIDETKCDAYGACVGILPDFIELDEWGYAHRVGDGYIPDAMRAAAGLAVKGCPLAAISIRTD